MHGTAGGQAAATAPRASSEARAQSRSSQGSCESSTGRGQQCWAASGTGGCPHKLLRAGSVFNAHIKYSQLDCIRHCQGSTRKLLPWFCPAVDGRELVFLKAPSSPKNMKHRGVRNPCCGIINHCHPYPCQPQGPQHRPGCWAAVCSCTACSPTPLGLGSPPWEASQPGEPVLSPLQVPGEQQGSASLAGCPHRTLTGMAPWGDTVPPHCPPIPFPHSTSSPNHGICLSTRTQVCVHPVPSPCPAQEGETSSVPVKSSSWLSNMNCSMI